MDNILCKAQKRKNRKRLDKKGVIIIRIWHYALLPYLPDAQFKGQLRELVAIRRDWEEKGKTNHLLINQVMEFPKRELTYYFLRYEICYHQRYGVYLFDIARKFLSFSEKEEYITPTGYAKWHNKEYLRICMSNLAEKHFYGIGKSRITDEEWKRLLDGYKAITGEEYEI